MITTPFEQNFSELVERLREMTIDQRRELGLSARVSLSSINKMIYGTQTNPGIKTCASLWKSLGAEENTHTNNTSNHKNNHPQGGNSMMSVKPPLSTPHRATNKTPSGAVSGIHSEGVGQ